MMINNYMDGSAILEKNTLTTVQATLGFAS